jgi:hypothetical protein
MHHPIHALRAIFKGVNMAASMVLRIWPIWVLQVAVWGMLVYLGQVQDLVHETKREPLRHFFMYLAVVFNTGLQAAAIQRLIRGKLIFWSPSSSRFLLFVRHFTPTLLGIMCGLLPLVPYYGLPLNMHSMAQGWLHYTPLLRDRLLPDPAFVATFGVLDYLCLVLLVPSVLFARFYDPGSGKRFHPHMLLYAIPAGVGFVYCVFVGSLPLWPFVSLSTAYMFALDLWLAWQRTIFTTASRAPFVVFTLCVVIGTLLFLCSPASWSYLVGPLPTILCFTGALLLLIIVAQRLPAAIRLSAVVAVAILVANGNYGSRRIRLLPPATQHPVLMQEHALQWLLERREEIAASKMPYPVFFVTADGGGIRAAYWTSTILGALADAYPQFPRHVFLLSGVSGGSVGVTVFAGLTAVSPSKSFEQNARAILSKDFLAAPLGFLLWRDPWTSTFCYGNRRLATCPTQIDDRATMLERVLENSFRMVTGSDILLEPFSQLWAGDRRFRVPSLLLNCTKRGDGHFRVMSNLAIASLPSDPVTANPIDLARGLPRDHDLPLSTAAFLSARFPLISPNGATPVQQSLEVTEDILDGGYFDNSGGAGALMGLQAFLAAASQISPPPNIKPVALVITNDTNRKEMLPTLEPPGQCEFLFDTPSAPVATLLMTPLGTLDGMRQQAAEARRTAFINEITQAPQGELLKFGLFRCTGDVAFPLGWTLSGKSREQIDDKIEYTRKASQDFAHVGEFLARQP